jgi:hypothetical protein
MKVAREKTNIREAVIDVHEILESDILESEISDISKSYLGE